MFSTAAKLFLVTSCLSLLFAEEAHSACGKFVVVKGDVQIDIAATQKTEKAKVNSEICAGDTATSSKDARAKIVMVDGNELNLSPDTKLKIEGYEFKPEQEKKKVLLNVLFGKVRANVKQKYDDQAKDSASNSFQVQTKSAVAGVRGTDFLTSYNASTGKSEVVTFSGKVEVGQTGPGGRIINSVSVGAGEKTIAAPNQPPSPAAPVPAGELKQLNTSTNAASNSPSNTANSSASNSNSKSSNSNASSSTSSSSSSSANSNSSSSSNSSSGTSTNSSASASSPSANTATPTDARAPASVGGGSSILSNMTDSKDIGGAAGQTSVQAPPTFSGPVLPPLPVTPTVVAVPVIPNLSTIVQSGGSATVNIVIKTK